MSTGERTPQKFYPASGNLYFGENPSRVVFRWLLEGCAAWSSHVSGYLIYMSGRTMYDGWFGDYSTACVKSVRCVRDSQFNLILLRVTASVMIRTPLRMVLRASLCGDRPASGMLLGSRMALCHPSTRIHHGGHGGTRVPRASSAASGILNLTLSCFGSPEER